MRIGKRLLGILAGLLILSMLLAACGGSKSSAGDAAGQPRKSLKVGYLNVMDDAQVMLAKDAGFFDKHGLDVELMMFDSGTDLIKAIVGGQLQAGVLGFTNAVAWADKGADLKVVAGAQMGYHSILVKRGSGIKTVADLKGKKLASQQKGSTADIVLTGVVFPDAGLTKDDVTMVYTSPANAIQALAAGQVDAAFVFEPFEQISRATADVEAIYEIGKVWPFPCMVVITSGKALSDDRDAINRLLDAQEEAIEMLANNPKEAAQFITYRFIKEASLTGPNGTVPAVDVIQQAIETQMFHWDLTSDEIKRMDDVVKLMVDQGILTQYVPGEKYLDLTWQQNKTKKTGHKH